MPELLLCMPEPEQKYGSHNTNLSLTEAVICSFDIRLACARNPFGVAFDICLALQKAFDVAALMSP